MAVAETKPVKEANDLGPRCIGCNRMLAVVLARPWVIDCPRCGMRNQGA